MNTETNKMNSENNRNNKGFTLVELVVTITILSVLVVIVGGTLATVYKARAKSASNRIASIMSQCKINSLSGIDSTMELKYNSEKKTYICTLTKTGETVPYKTEEIGNSHVNIFVKSNNNINISDKSLKIRFSKNTGAVESITQGETPLKGLSSNKIAVVSSKTYEITLYTRTGEIEVALL